MMAGWKPMSSGDVSKKRLLPSSPDFVASWEHLIGHWILDTGSWDRWTFFGQIQQTAVDLDGLPVSGTLDKPSISASPLPPPSPTGSPL